MRHLILLLFLHTTVSGNIPLPGQSSFKEQIETLQKRVLSKELSPEEQRNTRHELHRIMLLVYITSAHGIERHARLNAQHTFARLYHAHSSDQPLLRDYLALFIDEVVNGRQLESTVSQRSEHMLTSITMLEEGVSPLLKDDKQTREFLFAFTQSMFGLVTTERITSKHVFLVSCGLVVGVSAIIVMLLLMNKIIETRTELNHMTHQFMHNIDSSLSRFADEYTGLEQPTLMQRGIIRLFGNSRRARNARARRVATETNTQ